MRVGGRREGGPVYWHANAMRPGQAELKSHTQKCKAEVPKARPHKFKGSALTALWPLAGSASHLQTGCASPLPNASS